MDELRLGRVAAGAPLGHDLTVRPAEIADPQARGLLLDALAAGATAGSAACLDALLGVIDKQHLDRPAIRRMIVNDHDADDVHQDVLIAVSRSIANFRAESTFSTWLHSIARNTAASHLRRQRDTEPLHEGHEPTDAQRLSSLIASRTVLGDAVAALPEHYRSVVVMRDIEQRSYDEIANTLGIELNTVKSRIARGRALVAHDLRDGSADG